MTREQAVAVACALDNLEGFEILAEQIQHVVDNAMNTCDLFDFAIRLNQFLEKELEDRKKILESL